MTLQEKILYCRKKEGLSQETLAERIGVSRQAISKWETGEATPEVGKLSLLAKTFNVTVDWLLSEEEPHESADSTFNYGKNTDYYSEANYHNGGSYYNSYERTKGSFAFIRKMIVRYSWIAGIYIAIFGLIMSGMGLGFRYMATTMIGGFEKQATGMFDFWNNDNVEEERQKEVDEFANELDEISGLFPELEAELSGEEDGYNDAPKTNEMSDLLNDGTSMMITIIDGFTGIVIILGIIMIVVGVIMAVYLKMKSNKSKSDMFGMQ